MSRQILPEPYGTEPLTTDRVVVKDSHAKLKEYPHLYSLVSQVLMSTRTYLIFRASIPE